MTKLDEDSYRKGRVIANNLKAAGHFTAAAALACTTALSTHMFLEEFDTVSNSVDYSKINENNQHLQDQERVISPPENMGAVYSLGGAGSAGLAFTFTLLGGMSRRRAVKHRDGNIKYHPSLFENDKVENDIP